MGDNTFVEIYLLEAQALVDYTGISYDLRTARDFAKLALSQTKFDLSEALTVATLIRYARAFVSGIRLNLYREEVSILSDEERSRHQMFIHIRDKHIAHSVSAFEESRPIARY